MSIGQVDRLGSDCFTVAAQNPPMTPPEAMLDMAVLQSKQRNTAKEGQAEVDAKMGCSIVHYCTDGQVNFLSTVGIAKA
jgi:hypothetical protein